MLFHEANAFTVLALPTFSQLFLIKGGFMKFTKVLFQVALFLIVLLSCSTPVHVQKDSSVNLSDYHTYMWVDTKANDQDNSARPTAYIDLSVRNRVNQELAKRGWKEVTENPDVL